MNHKFELGQKAEDIVTGFSGIIIAKNEWLNGCLQYCLKPRVNKEGKNGDGVWVDEGQLKIIGNGISVKKKKTGGPNPDAPKC